MMPIRLVLLTGCLLSALHMHLSAQPGVKAGVAFSSFLPSHSDRRTDESEDLRPYLGFEVDWLQHGVYAPDPGLQVGVTWTIPMSEQFSVQPELYYAHRGYHFGHIQNYNTSYGLDVHYLQLPILVKYRLRVDWNVKPGFLAGPYLALKLKATRTIKEWGEEDTKTVEGINDLDYGFLAALDATFDLWNQKLSAEMRLNWGIANIGRQQKGAVRLFDDPGTLRVISANILLGYVL